MEVRAGATPVTPYPVFGRFICILASLEGSPIAITRAHTHIHTFKYSLVRFSRSEVEAHGRICSWCILKQTKPGSNSHTHAPTHMHTRTHTHSHSQMSNFHILSLSKSLTHNVTSAMITGRDDSFPCTWTRVHTLTHSMWI